MANGKWGVPLFNIYLLFNNSAFGRFREKFSFTDQEPVVWAGIHELHHRRGRGRLGAAGEPAQHTGEVDVYHAGRFRYLGTRHGVQHWADSSKQIRVSTAIYRRHLYYLSGGDERIGDLLKEQLLAADTQKKVIIGRKLSPGAPVLPLPAEENPPAGGETGVGEMGFGHLMSAWVTEAERTNDPQWHERIRTALTTLADVPHALWNGSWVINLDTGACRVTGDPQYGLSHLAACFGLLLTLPSFAQTTPTSGSRPSTTAA